MLRLLVPLLLVALATAFAPLGACPRASPFVRARVATATGRTLFTHRAPSRNRLHSHVPPSCFAGAPPRGLAAHTRAHAKVPLTANGKRIEVAEGSSMMAACKRLGMKVPTNCKKGDCGTCTVSVGGKQIRACVGKVPPAPRLKSVLEKGLAVTMR